MNSSEKARELVLKWLLAVDDPPPPMLGPVFSEELIPRIAVALEEAREEGLDEREKVYEQGLTDGAREGRANERRKVGEEIVSHILQARYLRHPGFDRYAEEYASMVRELCGIEEPDGS